MATDLGNGLVLHEKNDASKQTQDALAQQSASKKLDEMKQNFQTNQTQNQAALKTAHTQDKAAVKSMQNSDWNALGKSLKDAVAQAATNASDKYSAQNEQNQRTQQAQYDTRSMHNETMQRLLGEQAKQSADLSQRQAEQALDFEKWHLTEGEAIKGREEEHWRDAFNEALWSGNTADAKAIMEQYPQYFAGWDLNERWRDSLLEQVGIQIDLLQGYTDKDGVYNKGEIDILRERIKEGDPKAAFELEVLEKEIANLKQSQDTLAKTTIGQLGDDFWQHTLAEWRDMPAHKLIEDKQFSNEAKFAFEKTNNYLTNTENHVLFNDIIGNITDGIKIYSAKDLMSLDLSKEQFEQIGILSGYLSMLDDDPSMAATIIYDPKFISSIVYFNGEFKGEKIIENIVGVQNEHLKAANEPILHYSEAWRKYVDYNRSNDIVKNSDGTDNQFSQMSSKMEINGDAGRINIDDVSDPLIRSALLHMTQGMDNNTITKNSLKEVINKENTYFMKDGVLIKDEYTVPSLISLLEFMEYLGLDKINTIGAWNAWKQ